MVNTNELKENKDNANRHNTHQIDRLCKLIKHQGFRNPLIVSNRTGLIVSGHARKTAAEKLGLEKLPVIFQDFDSAKQEYAYLISDNEIARWAELDFQDLYINIEELKIDDIELLGLDGFKFDEPEKKEEKPSVIEVIISCKDELEQSDLLEEFNLRELNCRGKK